MQYVNYEARQTYDLLVNVMDDGKVEDPTMLQSDGTPRYMNTEKLNKTFSCTVKVTGQLTRALLLVVSC